MLRLTERGTLWIVFLLNASFFLIEGALGLLSNSLGLVSDSLDMLSDAAIYGLSLYALAKCVHAKKQIAFLSACIQSVMLAFVGYEIVRRFAVATPVPEYRTMITVSLFAFMANLVSRRLLQRLRSKDANVRASEICSHIDCLINLGVVCGGVCVLLSGSKWPDLVVSAAIWAYAVREVGEMFGEARCTQCGSAGS
ncbi:MAG: cation transporter [Rickettsiales bacterium]|jgi:cation diffusion facilitator family transporter|nr:cation transporter [Rickettsiales bacterium]